MTNTKKRYQPALKYGDDTLLIDYYTHDRINLYRQFT